MTLELTYLTFTLLLALCQVGAAALAKRRQEPRLWAAGARDEGEPHYTGLAARLMRAQANLFETLPIFIGTVLIAHVAGREGSLTAWGCMLTFWARLVYVPLYAFGVPYLRTVAWLVAAVGLCMLLSACLLPH